MIMNNNTCAVLSHSLTPDESEEAVAYKNVKSEYMKYTQDFLTLGKIASLVSALEDSYMVRIVKHNK